MLVLDLAGHRVFPAVFVFTVILFGDQRQHRLAHRFAFRVLDLAEIGVDQAQVGAVGNVALGLQIDHEHIQVILQITTLERVDGSQRALLVFPQIGCSLVEKCLGLLG